jgi:tagatose-1,6-bisphosphate aldolase
MKLPMTPGRVRGLAATSSPAGVFRVLAVDHRDSLRVVIDPDDPSAVPASRVTEVKMDLIRRLGSEATAIMLDPEYSIAQAIVSGAIPGSVGFLAAVEAQGYLGDPKARQTTLLEDWGVEKAQRVGADAIKLLVLYRPDGGEVTDAQDRLIESVIADCALFDIPLFLEPLAYAIEPGLTTDSTEFAAMRRRIVVDTVKRLGAMRPDVLKVQFPIDTRYEPDRGVWVDACAELNESTPVPWALLSGGDPYELFREQVQLACEAGASGFLVGRALWGEYVRAPEEEQERIVDEVMRPRFAELSAIAAEFGHNWADRYQMPDVDERWFATY